MSVTQELLDLKFSNWTDSTNRHTVFVYRSTISDTQIAGSGSAYFDGLSYLQLFDNETDWLLGSTPNTNTVETRNWFPSNSDNEFTIDTWIYPISSKSRFCPICSSFKSVWWRNSKYDLGWVFRIDKLTGKLQIVTYVFGNVSSRVIESYGSVPLNQWTHVALMSWKMIPGSLKLFFINGYASGEYKNIPTIGGDRTEPIWTESFPISNLVSHESQFGTAGDPDFSPFYIGIEPRSVLTDPHLNSSFYYKKEYGIGANAYFGRFRICLGTRYQTTGITFDPLEDISETSSSTSTLTTTTTSTSTTQIERGEIPLVVDSRDLLALKLRNNIVDLTSRHFVKEVGNVNFYMSDLGCKSMRFDGTNYLKVILNQVDFSLGSTLIPNYFDQIIPVCLPNNRFSLEFWIYPDHSVNRYVGICGSFSDSFFPTDIDDTVNYGTITSERDYKVGWTILLDTTEEKLQIVSYEFGNEISKIESNLSVPLNQWTHVAIMSVLYNDYSSKYLFINGIPDSLNPYNNPETCWTNGIHRLSVNSIVDSYACLFIGIGINPDIEKSHRMDYRQGSRFVGNLSSFRLSSGARYPTDGTGFSLFRIPPAPITETTATSITTESTTASTTQPVPEGFVEVKGRAIASSSQYDGRPQYVNDNNIDTVWKPVTSTDAWIGIECK